MTSTTSRAGRGVLAAAALVACGAWTGACGPSDVAQKAAADVAELRRTQGELAARVAQVEGLRGDLADRERRIATLEAQLAKMDARFAAMEQRLGLVAFQPKHLVRAPGGSLQLNLPPVRRLSGPGDGGESVRLKKYLEARKGVIFVFWATWCVPCIADEELVAVQELRATMLAQGYDVISMAVDELGKVTSHAKADRWVYPLWHEYDGHIKLLPRSFIEKVGLGLPLFLVADSSGTVRYYLPKALTPESSAELVDAALHGM